MAMMERRVLRPKFPDIDVIEWRAVRFDYDRPSDTLYLDFNDESVSAVAYPLTEHLLVSVDPESEAVVGFQIEGFLAGFVVEAPTFLEFADLIGLTDAEVAAARSRVGPQTRIKAALRALYASSPASQRVPIGV